VSEGAAAAFERGTALLQSGDAAAALPLLREAMHALPGEARAARGRRSKRFPSRGKGG
jgi:thioredoxin-like negative regulator of GroEL